MGPEVAVPIFFFLSIFGIVAVTLWRRLMVERERQQTIRLAIERGQALDASFIEKLGAPPVPKTPFNPYAWPIVVVSTGIGFGVFSTFLRHIDEEAFWSVMGVGCMVAIIGLGMFLGAYLRPRPTG
jgi:Domain of unknown function (DUF6249)